VYGGGPETLLVGEETGRVVAALQLHPLRQWVAGEPLRSAGIGTVAIAATHRRRGLAADLMNAALREARERGDVVSSLYPFRTSFYQRLGYGQAGEALQYQIAPAMLPDAREREAVELLENRTARAEALALYNAWARTQTGQLERGERVWASVTTSRAAPVDRVLAGYRGAAGGLEGYVLAVYRSDLPPESRRIEVDDIVWTTTAARRGLYGWLASLSDQWREVLIRALPSHRLGDWIREPRLPHGAAPHWRLWAPGATLLMGPMFRLLDVRAAWEGRRVETGPALAVRLDIDDPQIEENGGAWTLSFDAGRTSIERGSGGARPDLAIRTDVATLSRIFVGAIPPGAALRAGNLECDRPELLANVDAMLALPEPWTFDRY
jgi:predicted acetyltransferase